AADNSFPILRIHLCRKNCLRSNILVLQKPQVLQPEHLPTLRLLSAVPVHLLVQAQLWITPPHGPHHALEVHDQVQGLLRFRSEEHTLNSSHVKISYAVFCLKKKKHTKD